MKKQKKDEIVAAGRFQIILVTRIEAVKYLTLDSSVKFDKKRKILFGAFNFEVKQYKIQPTFSG